jgi:hypothetical protein
MGLKVNRQGGSVQVRCDLRYDKTGLWVKVDQAMSNIFASGSAKLVLRNHLRYLGGLAKVIWDPGSDQMALGKKKLRKWWSEVYLTRAVAR